MTRTLLVGGLALTLSAAASAVEAQVVQAGVVIRSGPVAGHVVVGAPAAVYHPPVRKVIVVERPAPRIIVVERVYVPRWRAHGWWKRHGYRPVVVYYDGHRYYDRWHDGWKGLRRIEVYERGGRYYRFVDDDRDHRRYDDRHDHRDRDHDHYRERYRD